MPTASARSSNGRGRAEPCRASSRLPDDFRHRQRETGFGRRPISRPCRGARPGARLGGGRCGCHRPRRRRQQCERQAGRPQEEIRRLEPLISALKADRTRVSVNSSLPEVQRFAIARGVDFLNNIQGFPDPSFYPELAAARCRLVVMHAVRGGAGRSGESFRPTRCGTASAAFSASASRPSNEPASLAGASSSTRAWAFF